ncbi:MAG TPA: M13 family metallopeptidase [Rhizomicrobium sp.]|jgi:putative endopeptidase|nr:M13 family metallopeptidase [Rhizomicrobium sp.]
MHRKIVAGAMGAMFILALFGWAAICQSATVKPQYGAWGFDLAGADKSVKPGDDFFQYAGGTWLAKTPIPGDKPAVTLRLAMSDQTEQRLHDIMEAAAATVAHQPTGIEGKVGAFYKAFMDEARVEQLGAKAIAPQLAAVRAANTRAGLAALMGRNNADFFGTVFAFGIDIDVKDPKKYAFYIGQAGLSLPDRDYYLKPEFAAQKAKFAAYVSQMLTLLQWPDAPAQAKNIVAFETAIAEASWTKAQDRDPDATYNPMSVTELQKLAPGFDWAAFLKSSGPAGLDHVIVAEKSAFPKIADIFAKTPVATLQAWEAFTVADNAAPYLSSAFDHAYFDLHGKTLTGQEQEQVRWKRGVHAVSGGDYGAGERTDRFGNLGWAVGQLYTAKYFPPAAKAKIEALVANIKAAYRQRIQHLDWMSPQTKVDALKKLDTYNIKVGYPDHPRDYSKVVITSDDLTGDVVRAATADWAFYTGRFFGPVDRSDWGMTPQTNDAYNGSLRDIVFPAGILQPPIFDANADPAVNYGAAGAVIGHELTHGFDDQGRKFDASGALRDWWQPADAAKFEARAKMLGAQYSATQPLPGIHINGDLTMGENIADLGGVTLALAAYHNSLHGKPAPVIDGFTGDQRVLLGWAQAWRGKLRDNAIRRQVVSDPHSPRKYRVNNIVRNVDAWYAAFDVKPGDKMYIPPDKRVHIW